MKERTKLESAIATIKRLRAAGWHLHGDRERIRQRSATIALHLLRTALGHDHRA